jgi:Leucine-rich repeat (LRR) protein
MTYTLMTSIKKRLFLALTLFYFVAAQAQNIPDAAFAAAIRSQCLTCIDAGNNLLPPAASRRALYLNFLGVTNLAGIQGFTSLETLECEGGVNTLSSIPAGILPASLQALKLNGNRITSLPALPAGLLALWCSRNQLTSLPALPPALYDLQVEQNMLTSLPALPPALNLLNVVSNRLTSLPALPSTLTKLYCLRNQLTSLPTLPAGLENLYCMFNDITSLPTLPNSLIDLRLDQAKIPCLPNVPPGLTVYNQLEFVIPTPPVCGLDVPDPNFAAAIRSVCPTCITPLPNRRLLPPAANLVSLNVSGKVISDLTGIQGFTSLQELFCYDNRLATLPPLPSTLTLLSCFNNQLTSLSLPNGLKELYCYDNPLGGLPNPLPSGLQKLNCVNNLFPTIPTLPNSMTQLIVNTSVISCLPNLPPSMTVFSSTAPLTAVVLPVCGTEIDIPDPNFAAAIRLACPTCITALPNRSLLPPAANLASLNVGGKNISDLTGIRGFTSLQSLFCFDNRLVTLPTLPSSLKELSCFNNQLTSLNLPSGLTSLYCYDNPIANLPNPLPSGLQVLNCVRSLYTRLPTLPSTMTRLILSPAIITCLPNNVAGMQVYNNALAAIPTPPVCGFEIPDVNFAAAIRLQCVSCITPFPDRFLLPPAANLTNLNVSGKNIADLTGIEAFTSLLSLNCFNNRLVTLPPLPSTLLTLSCFNNQLTSLSLPSGLKELYCYDNPIASLPNPLPSGLGILNCVRSLYTRLPILPNTMADLTISPAIITCLPNIVAGMRVYNDAGALIPTPPLCPICTPTVSIAPALQNVQCSETTVTLTASANGTAGATVKWQRKRPIDAGFIDFTAPVSYVSNEIIVLTVPVSVANNGTQFRAVFTGSCAGSGPVPTAAAVINVKNGAKIPDLFFQEAIRRDCPQCIDDCNYLTDAVSQITSLFVDNLASNQLITDLTGLEGFTNLRILNVSNNNIKKFPNLPTLLTKLICVNSNLTSLPELPLGLEILDCRNNRITGLPSLPSSLMNVDCSSNKLAALPALPTNLMTIDCSNNQIARLPSALPSTLKTLYCHKNQLTTLPNLPNSMRFLNCSNNILTELPPVLPTDLHALVCSRNPFLTCLPIIPSKLRELYISPEKITCLRNIVVGLRVYDAFSEPITMPNFCPATQCPTYLVPDTVTLGRDEAEGIKGGEAVAARATSSRFLHVLNVFPNPVDKQLQVEFVAAEAGETKLVVNDILGRQIISQNVAVTKGFNATSIDMTNAPTGAYFLMVNDGKMQVVRRVIKN